MASLFISYSHIDIGLARRLTDAFTKQEIDFWIDWEGIPPTVDWWKEIEKAIEEADAFLFLLSPDSAISKVCKQEIEHAIKNGKRLIPIVIRDVKSAEVPPDLKLLNWIFLRENDDFSSAFDKLLTAIKTDYEWVQTHRQLQVKALEWERNNKEYSYLLRGKELLEAEYQLDLNKSKEPYSTDLQFEFTSISRQTFDQQRRRNFVLLLVAMIIIASLAYKPMQVWLLPEYPDWEEIPITPEFMYPPLYITMNLNEPNEVYIADQTLENLYTSDNGGNTWAQINVDGLTANIAGLSALENNLYILTTKSVLLSPDKGKSWVPAGVIQPGNNSRLMSIAINPFDAKEVYVGDSTGTIYYSSDSGAAWDKDKVQTGFKGRQIRTITTNGSVLILATEEGVWISMIDGTQWSEISLAGCSEYPATVSALGLQYPYSEPPEDAAYGLFAAVAGMGLCDSDSKGDNTLLMTQYTDITSITLADQVDLFAYEGYIVANERILRKRILRYTDIDWWKIKVQLAFAEGE